MRKFLVIYHGNCIDGFTAASIACIRLLDRVDSENQLVFHAGVYGTQPPAVSGFDVYLVDFSYDAATLRKMAAKANSITILDHHKTAQADLQQLLDEGVVKGQFDMHKCGATLCWEHFNPDKPTPEGILLVEDRDLWLRKKKNSLAWNRVLGSYSMEPQIENFLFWYTLVCDQDEVERMHVESAPVQRFLSQCVRLYSEDAHEFVFDVHGDEYRVPAVNCPYFMSSEVLDSILNKSTEIPFAVAYNYRKLNGKDSFYVSMRSRSSFDVSKIAKALGGGGHAQAAAFSISGSNIEDVMRRLISCLAV